MINLPGVKADETKDRVGRPTLYRSEYDSEALALCEQGATNAQLAEWFEVSERTVNLWQVTHPSFGKACKVGKSEADDKVEASFHQLARGFWYTEQQAIKVKTGQHSEEVQIVDVERYSPPNPAAGAKWLAVRRGYSETQRVEHSGAIKTSAIDLTGLTDDQLSKYMAFMESVTTKESET